MKTVISIFTTLLLLAIFLVACDNLKGSAQSEKTILILSTPSSINTFKIDDTINLVIENYSTNQIVIDPKETILSVNTENGWGSIENLMDYSDMVYVLMPKDQGDASSTVIGISPIIPNDKPATIRITIKGTIQSTKQKTEAQIDVTINP